MANSKDLNEQLNSSMYFEEERSAGHNSGVGSGAGSGSAGMRQENEMREEVGMKPESRVGSGNVMVLGSDTKIQGSDYHDSLEGSYGNVIRTGAEYYPELHDLGRDKQRLTGKVQDHGIPAQTVPYHPYQSEDASDVATEYDEHGYPVNKEKGKFDMNDKNLWQWSSSGKLKLACAQPVVPVPIVQDILRRDKIILVPQVEVTDVIAPKVYNQNIKHEVPKVDVQVKDTLVDIPNVRYVEKEVIVPIITGYTHKFVPKWEIHEVPRPIMKYIGEQKIVEVEVPEIKYVDKIVEREVVVDTVEKRVPKIIEVPKYTDEVQYVWKPIEKIVYVQKLVPKFDVNLDCPPPLIVPYPVQTVKQIPPVMVKKDTEIPLKNYENYNAPTGSVRVPEEYIQHFSKQDRHNNDQNKTQGPCFFNCCNGAERQSNEHMSFENVTQQNQMQNQMNSNTNSESHTSFDPYRFQPNIESRSVIYDSNTLSRSNEPAPSISVQN